MDIFATWHYRSAHGLMKAVSGLIYAWPAKVYLGWPGGLAEAIFKAPSRVQ
jgi:hypothetical protein